MEERIKLKMKNVNLDETEKETERKEGREEGGDRRGEVMRRRRIYEEEEVR